jgi:hypothetical protein
MRKQWSLGRQFWIWIFGGLFVIVGGLLWAKQSLCSAQLNYVPAFLCEEETKFTDLLLAFFTYCLVIVGWFTIRNSERTTQNLERAFLSVGPTKIEKHFRQPDDKGYTPPYVRMTLQVHNTGRTGAIITKVYGEFSETAPTGNEPIYEHGDSQNTDLSIAAGVSTDLEPFKFETDFMDNQFFWGYVEYLDIFKIRHTARFCAAIFPNDPSGIGKYQLAGSDAWRECD